MRHLIATLALGCAFAVSTQAATLLVLNKDDATLSLIDPATGASLATVPTGPNPHEVEVAPDGRTAVVANYGTQPGGNSLSIIDIASRRERARVDLGELRRPHGVAASGQRVYFTAEDSRHVGRVDTTTGRIDWQFPTNQERTHMVVASRDGSTLFTANVNSGSVSIIEHAGEANARQTVVTVGSGPEGLSLTPDGRQLWVANSQSGNLSIIDVASRAVVKTIDIGTWRSNRLKFTPDGTLALVSDLTAGELVVVDVKSQAVKTRLPIGRGASGILIVPDGSKAYVASASERKLAVVDLASLSVVGQVATGCGPDGMAWIP